MLHFSVSMVLSSLSSPDLCDACDLPSVEQARAGRDALAAMMMPAPSVYRRITLPAAAGTSVWAQSAGDHVPADAPTWVLRATAAATPRPKNVAASGACAGRNAAGDGECKGVGRRRG